MDKTIPNYFLGVEKNFEYVFNLRFKNRKKLNMLQIGAFSGDASKWILNYIDPSSTLFDVDTWKGSLKKDGNLDLHDRYDMNKVKKMYDEKTKNFKNLITFQGTSKEYFESIKDKNIKFDFVYIDGSHLAEEVYCDAVSSYKKLSNKGIIAFDDYMWNIKEDPDKIPHHSINKFILNHNVKKIIDENSNIAPWPQMWVIKTK